MQLSSHDGISCDYCGTQYRKEFEYYSVDIHDAYAVNDRLTTLEIMLRSMVVFGFDLCTSCYSILSQIVVKFYRPIPTGLVCNLTGAEIHGDFLYHYIDITRVRVKIPLSGKADITTFPRELEFAISAAAGTEMVNKVLNCRKGATEWLAKSSM